MLKSMVLCEGFRDKHVHCLGDHTMTAVSTWDFRRADLVARAVSRRTS